MEVHVHQFYLSWNNGFVDNSDGGGVISLDGRGRLRPSHFDECFMQRNHFLRFNEKRAKFRFGCRGHDKFDDCGNGENVHVRLCKIASTPILVLGGCTVGAT